MENITYPDDYYNGQGADEIAEIDSQADTELEKYAIDAYEEHEEMKKRKLICCDGWTIENTLKEADERRLRRIMPNGKCIERAIDGDLQNKKGKVAKDARFWRWFLTVEMAEDFYAEVKNGNKD